MKGIVQIEGGKEYGKEGDRGWEQGLGRERGGGRERGVGRVRGRREG